MTSVSFAWRSWYAVSFQGNESRLMNTASGNLPSWSPPYGEPNFEQKTDQPSAAQQWQFVANAKIPGTWLVRCAGAGSSMYLSTYGLPQNKLSGRTIATLKYADLYPNDDSMAWSIQPWGDGWYGLTNTANGSDWYLTVTMTGGVGYELYMAKASGPTNVNRFNFTTAGAMDTYGFMRAQVPGSMINTTTLTTTPAPSDNNGTLPTTSASSDDGCNSTSTTSNVCHDNNLQAADTQGISPGASAAIAAAVTFVICFLTFGAAWLSLRRGYKGRGEDNFVPGPIAPKQDLASSHQSPPATSYYEQPSFKELPSDRRTHVQSQIQELGSGYTYTELDASNRRTHMGGIAENRDERTI